MPGIRRNDVGISPGSVERGSGIILREPGGIVLPDIAKNKPHRGRVIAVGPGKLLGNGLRAPMSVKVGDDIIYALYEGIDVSVGKDKFLAFHESEIMAVIVD